ncbi:unnamed protein product, partial [Schistosoma intercalatum]
SPNRFSDVVNDADRLLNNSGTDDNSSPKLLETLDLIRRQTQSQQTIHKTIHKL